MIGLSTTTFDITGDLILEENTDSDLNNVTRRTTKTKTLDGSVVVEDRGFTSKDREFIVRVNATKELREKLLYLIENHSSLILSMEDGAFEVAPTSFRMDKDVFDLGFTAR